MKKHYVVGGRRCHRETVGSDAWRLQEKPDVVAWVPRSRQGGKDWRVFR